MTGDNQFYRTFYRSSEQQRVCVESEWGVSLLDCTTNSKIQAEILIVADTHEVCTQTKLMMFD